jgi:hypothetical protein
MREAVAAVVPPPNMAREDIELLTIAQTLLGRVWVHGRHEVATALRTADGAVYTGVHMEGSCRLRARRAARDSRRGVGANKTLRTISHHRAVRCVPRIDQRLQSRCPHLDHQR